MELCLPAEKIERLRATIHSWREKCKCTQRELESLIGLLGHACKVVRPGRCFLSDLLDLERSDTITSVPTLLSKQTWNGGFRFCNHGWYINPFLNPLQSIGRHHLFGCFRYVGLWCCLVFTLNTDLVGPPSSLLLSLDCG